MNVYFWQQMVTPHMAGLAAAMAERGHAVTYIANAAMSEDRAAQGWQAANVGNARLIMAAAPPDVREVAAVAPDGAIHITQGLRGNGLVSLAQQELRSRAARIWVIHEKVDDRGARGWLKRVLYRRIYHDARDWVERLLAIGDGADDWSVARGFPKSRVSPFAYFLPRYDKPPISDERQFTFCFAGRLIPLKRVDLLVKALSGTNEAQWEFDVIGDGPLADQLRNQAACKLGDREIRWHGTVPNGEARALIAKADCLVLPSDYDGWGAVISEALIAGTRVICSTCCGASSAVRQDPLSRVFIAGDQGDLTHAIQDTIACGKVTLREREERIQWAASLTGPLGAAYLEALIDGGNVPLPWKNP